MPICSAISSYVRWDDDNVRFVQTNTLSSIFF